MVTNEEQKFIEHWEKVRDEQNTLSYKILSGLPMAMLFALPILLFLVAVRFFFKDWYAKISHIGTGPFIAAIIAIMVVVVFYSWFRMHFKWEMNEQFYQELKSKQKKQSAVS